MSNRKIQLKPKSCLDDSHRTGRLPAGRHTRNLRKLTDITQLRKLDYLINCFHYAGKIYDDILFDMAMRYMTVSEKRDIVAQAFERAVTYKIDCDRWISQYNDGTESTAGTLQGLNTNDRLKKSIFLCIFNFLVSFREKQTFLKRDCPLQKKIE